MKTLGTHNYYVYILTNKNKTVLYTGITNNISERIEYHKMPELSSRQHFTYKYKCFYLIYYEHFFDVDEAISREKQIKGYSRKKKEDLINVKNPEWKFLNNEI
jgi:putative endonuclease